eukprot:Pgem_evm1s20072
MFFSKTQTGFGTRSTAEQVTMNMDLTGKTYLITGMNSGLGLETARVLAMRGGNIIGLARTKTKAEDAMKNFKGNGAKLAVECELSNPDSIRQAIKTVTGLREEVGEVDVIVANAGIGMVPKLELIHGYEKQFFTNHIGHFMLVTGLITQNDKPSTADAGANIGNRNLYSYSATRENVFACDGRVVMVSSVAHDIFSSKDGYSFEEQNLKGHSNNDSYNAEWYYGQSKMANLLFAKSLAQRFKEAGSSRTAISLDPGTVYTNITRDMSTWDLIKFSFKNFTSSFGIVAKVKTVGGGAATQTYVATGDLLGHNGNYWKDCNPSLEKKKGTDMATAENLWNVSENILFNLE